jgi:hypothetical protein
MVKSRPSGIYYYGSLSDSTYDTFIMKLDTNLDTDWTNKYPLQQTSEYGFDVSPNDSFIIVVTTSGGMLTVIKIEASDGSTTTKYTSSILQSTISRIYVSISPLSDSVFFTSTEDDGVVCRSDISNLSSSRWMDIEIADNIYSIKAYSTLDVVMTATAKLSQTSGMHLRSYTIQPPSDNRNWDTRYNFNTVATYRNLMEIIGSTAYNFISMNTGKIFMRIDTTNGNLIDQHSYLSACSTQRSTNMEIFGTKLYIIANWDTTILLIYDTISGTFDSIYEVTPSSLQIISVFVHSSRIYFAGGTSTPLALVISSSLGNIEDLPEFQISAFAMTSDATDYSVPASNNAILYRDVRSFNAIPTANASATPTYVRIFYLRLKLNFKTSDIHEEIMTQDYFKPVNSGNLEIIIDQSWSLSGNFALSTAVNYP